MVWIGFMKAITTTYKRTLILCISCIAVMLCSIGVNAQSQHKLLRKGDTAYEKNDYSASEESYRKALEISRNPKGNFNLGNSLYNQERYEEAMEAYQDATAGLSDDIAKSEAFFNLGNAAFQNEDIKSSVEAYKKALTLNPKDEEIRSNLFSAMYMKKIMEQQQQEQQEQEQQESDEEQEESEEEQEKKENEEQQESDEQKEEEQEKSDEQEQQDQEQQDSINQSQSSELDSISQAEMDSMMQINVSKEEALRLLQIADKEEKKVQEKLIRSNNNAVRPDKDW